MWYGLLAEILRNGTKYTSVGPEILKLDRDLYNGVFFEKHIDKDTLTGFLKVSSIYYDIIKLLDKRYESNDIVMLQKLDEELKGLTEEIIEIRKTQIDFCNDKLDNDNLRKAMHQTGEEDFEKLEEITKLNSKIDNMTADNDIKLEKAKIEEQNKSEEYGKIDEERTKLDTDIENCIDKLNKVLAELDGKNIDIFNGLDIDTLREQYEQGLVDMFPNVAVRKTYASYLFDVLKRENKMLSETYATAQQFVSSARKENGYDVQELAIKNDKINMFSALNGVVHNELDQLIPTLFKYEPDTNQIITQAGNNYLSVQPFIDGMYDYIANMEQYEMDNSKSRTDFRKINAYNDKMQELFSKTNVGPVGKVINQITNTTIMSRGLGLIIHDAQPYDFAMRANNLFTIAILKTRTQVQQEKQTTISNEQPIEQINKANKSNDIQIQQLSEEQKRMFAENFLTTSVSTIDDESLNSGDMKR